MQPDWGRGNEVVDRETLLQMMRVFHRGAKERGIYVTEIIAMFTCYDGVLGFGKHSAVCTITYELIGTGGRASSIAYTVDDVTVIATALATGGKPKVSLGANGLGVHTRKANDLTGEVDGEGVIEILRLTFDRVVELVSVVFDQVGLDDDFSLAVDGTTLISSPIPK